MSKRPWTIVVAAGKSVRFGGSKLFEQLGDRRVVDHAVAAAAAVSDGVVLVIDSTVDVDFPSVAVVVAGGDTRSASVRAGLAAVPDAVDSVLVHDAARPAATPALFARVIAALADPDVDAVVPAVAVVDTVKVVDGSGRVTETPDRSTLVAVQTPQGFRRSTLAEAHACGGGATDDAALIEDGGGTVVTVDGDQMNFKITARHDLTMMRSLWPSRSGDGTNE